MREQNNNFDRFNIRKAALATFAAFAICSTGAFVVTETIVSHPQKVELLYDFIAGTALATVVGAAALGPRKREDARLGEMSVPSHTTGRNE